MIKKIVKFFDKAEDKLRSRLSHTPIPYAFIGGICLVLFWRGVWHTGDILMEKGGFLGWMFYEPITIVWTAVVMLSVGLLVSLFIGDSIIISGVKQDKKTFEKTEQEIKVEENQLSQIENKIKNIEKILEEVRNKLN